MSAARLAAIKIPKRIERGPTDILKALSSTVKYLPKEPEPQLQDDPYLLPARPAERVNYTLARLSGQRTAKFILNKHPEIFFRDQAEPKVEAYAPPEQYLPEMEFSEEDIKWCIENKDAQNGSIAYNAMVERGIKLGDEILMQFFEMICYTNEEKLLDDMENEISRFFSDPEKQLVDYTWRKSGLAHKIFNQYKEDLDPPRMYSAMIAGLVKFNEHSTAYQVFEDFKDAHPNDGLLLAAYDALLRSIPRLQSSISTAYSAVEGIVRHMEANLIAPDLLVFNSIMRVYQSYTCDDQTCLLAFKLMNDMKTLQIEPSLSTYTSLISIVCRNKGGRTHGHMVPEILDLVGNSPSLSIMRDERDNQFLNSVMLHVTRYLHNLKYANKLHKIYLRNPSLFEHQQRRTQYLNNYFLLIITTDSLENILNFYDTYVPMTLRPSFDVFDALAEALDIYQADEAVVNRIAKDIVNFRVVGRLKNDAIYRKCPEYVEALEEKDTT